MPRDAMTAPERLAQEPCAPQAARNAARAGRRGLPPCTARRPAARRGPSRAPPPEAPADWYVRYRKAIDTHGPQEQTIAVRWILRVLRAIPLTPWWVAARHQRNVREMREHLRRYYANSQ
jgi:hypothetical protein